MTTYPRFAVLVLALLALAASACQFPVFFPEFVVNTSDPSDTESGDVAIGKDGDFVVTWQEYDDEVLGRRFDRLTAPLGDPFPVNAATTNAQDESSIAMDAQGRFVAVWMEDATAIWGRRFDADGTPLSGNFQVNTSTPVLAGFPHVASDPSGNFVVAWTAASAANPEVMARRFDSNGAPLGDEFQVNSFSTGYQAAGGAAMSPAGFVVSWGGEGFGNTNGIFARLFDSAGNPVTDDLEVNPDPITAPEPSSPDVAMSAKGDFVVVWDDGNPTYRVAGRRWSFNGTPGGDVFPISEGTLDAREPRVTSDFAGNFLVAWRGHFDPPEVSDGPSAAAGLPVPTVAVRLYDVGGNARSPQFSVNNFTSEEKFRMRPSLADDGSFVVAWTSGALGSYVVRARKSGVRAAPSILIDPSEMLASSPGAAPGNGVFEPGETQIIRTAWVNDTTADVESIFGNISTFTGPPGADYTINDDDGPLRHHPGGADQELQPVGRLLLRHRVGSRFRETPALGRPVAGELQSQPGPHLGAPPRRELPRRADRPPVLPFIETLFHNGVTGGCAAGGYCPGDPVTRAQMAVFLLKAKFGAAHVPPPCTGTVFTDVPARAARSTPGSRSSRRSDHRRLRRRQLLPRATPSPASRWRSFCSRPSKARRTTRPIARASSTTSRARPAPASPTGSRSSTTARITGGCSVAPLEYCPTNPNNRGQMAVFLVKTFGLVLYGG